MAFLMEFAENLIRRSMEDPVARRAARDAHLAGVTAKAEELCAPCAPPLRRAHAAGAPLALGGGGAAERCGSCARGAAEP